MRKLRLLLAPVLACVLLGATLTPASVGASTLPATPITLDPSLKIHPLLQVEAQTDPTRVVRVIVQQVRPPSTNLLSGLLGGSSATSSHLGTIYPFDSGATGAWAGAAGPADTGGGVTVAALDSGVDLAHPDLTGHVIGVNVNKSASGPSDGYGHGTHVAGII